MELRYHLDESVDHAVARGLIQRGISATTTTDAGLVGATDEEQLASAVGEGRVLVTHDRDFLRLAALSAAHCGIAYCPPRQRAIGQIILRLVHLWRMFTPDEMKGRVEYL